MNLYFRGRPGLLLLGVAAACLLWRGDEAGAIILHSSGDPSHNTNAPTGTLSGSGWQYEGMWGSFAGTVIAPSCFITMKHVGGTVGSQFYFRGLPYTTTAAFDDPETDLRIWQVCGTFPEFAPLYSGRSEVSRGIVVFGRGTRRGEEVRVGGLFGGGLRGWRWGNGDSVLRWGVNAVSSVVNGNVSGATGIGELLRSTFDAGAGGDEAHLSRGDSGGGVFLQEGGVWKLAGVNYSADGLYNTGPSGEGFYAAIFDQGGLYKGGPENWVVNSDLPGGQAGAFFAARISSRIGWINGVLQTAGAPLVQASPGIGGPFQTVAQKAIDASTRTVTVPVAGDSRFYRLQGCDALRIKSIRVSAGSVVISY